MAATEPDVDNLFPSVVWTVMSALRGSLNTPSPDGQVENPKLLTDPYTSEQSWLVDLGEVMRFDTDLTALEGQRLLRFDAIIDLDVVEIIAA
jgi:hypothetical protein